MPNHCHNRVTFYAHHSDDEDKARDSIAKLKKIFEDENVFTQIIPEPDWVNTPLTDETAGNWLHSKRGDVGELPVLEEDPWHTYRFQSTGLSDDRWYDWRLQNWDTKWDAYDVVVTDDDPDQFEVEFNTAWSPPEAICTELREQYPDLSVSWFYDEPGCEIAGYL
tara:strand:+ start:18 stop:512 length:495 start_codon:yes stop_codon:yes gene_type:complete